MRSQLRTQEREAPSLLPLGNLVYKGRHRDSSKASSAILLYCEDRDKEMLLYSVLDFQNFIHMIYYVFKKLTLRGMVCQL